MMTKQLAFKEGALTTKDHQGTYVQCLSINITAQGKTQSLLLKNGNRQQWLYPEIELWTLMCTHSNLHM